jgi:hypothetical protein
MLRTFIPRWGNRPPLEVEPLEIMQWLRVSKRMENLENPTVDKIRRVMNLVFKHGQTYDLIPRTGEANHMKFVRVKTSSVGVGSFDGCSSAECAMILSHIGTAVAMPGSAPPANRDTGQSAPPIAATVRCLWCV